MSNKKLSRRADLEELSDIVGELDGGFDTLEDKSYVAPSDKTPDDYVSKNEKSKNYKSKNAGIENQIGDKTKKTSKGIGKRIRNGMLVTTACFLMGAAVEYKFHDHVETAINNVVREVELWSVNDYDSQVRDFQEANSVYTRHGLTTKIQSGTIRLCNSLNKLPEVNCTTNYN